MKLLMCKPDYYGIQYEINPWMNINHGADQPLAVLQWENLYRTLLSCGADIALISPIPNLPDMVFTANGGLYYQHKIVLPHFKYKERQGELPYLKNWFLSAGFEISNDPTPDSPFFEGAGDALLAGEILFVAYGFRSEEAFYKQAKYLDQEKLVYCELINPYFYHIDTCFCPLNDQLAIWYPDAFSKNAQQRMGEKIELLPVTLEEAKRFACNAVVLNNHVIITEGCPQLTTLLEQRGFSVHAINMSEFLKAGGACKCLTLRIDE